MYYSVVPSVTSNEDTISLPNSIIEFKPHQS